ncbi:glycerate kinase [uncultured Pseudoflavonifractor sp.]|uniref:glycerate kinase family protein n=1 Tax=uncultured Pseudoflavonifractor sp. TaxID=1221379 RepID=UPI0025E46E5E|nr:glycerate kinase [uncultured Pseudoflavonifractor sp.]
MKKVVLIPDSFKGTLSSARICEIIGGRVAEHFPDCQVVSIPVADGGEGSVDCFLAALGGEKVRVTVKNPFFEEMEGFYGLVDGGETAVVEMAACAGLPLAEDRKDPRRTTTYGVGELILAAAARGVKKIIVGLGGSATNDGGCGAAAAVGVKFYNNKGKTFVPTGGTTHQIARIDMSGRDRCLEGVEIVAMCDIDNPMYGPAGAAYVFGPQKGADPETVRFLDEGIKHLAQVIRRDLSRDLAFMPGSGAAGAMGAGMAAFFGARLQMGIETVLDTVRFADVIAGADMIFTGEGRMDSQSLRGKAVIGVARRARLQNVPVVVIAGGADDGIDPAYGMGVTAVFSINRLPEDFSVSRSKSAENLALTADNILRLIKAAEEMKG